MPFIDLNSLESREIVPGYKAVFVHSQHMTLAYWTIEPDSSLPRHTHPHEQVLNLLEGRFELTLGDETRLLEPGAVVVIPSNVPHAGRSLTACRILDVFYPVREEYR